MTRTILVYGDSNTHGTLALAHLDDERRLPRGERWPDVMAALLAPDWDVIAEGHPGRTTVHADPVEGAHRSGLAVLPAILESHRPIDLLILKLGTNDLKARFAVTAGDIALSLGRLVREIAGSGAGPEGAAPAVMIVAPAPILEAGCLADMFSGGAVKSRALAPLAAAEAARQGAAFFDAGTVIAVDPVDGIHYDAAAHAALGRAIAQSVRRHWP